MNYRPALNIPRINLLSISQFILFAQSLVSWPILSTIPVLSSCWLPLNSPSPFIRANMQTPRSTNEQLPLWENRNPTTSYMWDFLQLINEKYNRTLKNYDDLYNWSIECLPQFWEEVWAFTGVHALTHCSGQGERQNGYHINQKKPFKHVSAIISSLFVFISVMACNFSCQLSDPILPYIK